MGYHEGMIKTLVKVVSLIIKVTLGYDLISRLVILDDRAMSCEDYLVAVRRSTKLRSRSHGAIFLKALNRKP